MRYRRKFYGFSDIGRKRSLNEDAFYCSELEGLCIVADGMGGHSFGEVASRMVVEGIREYFRQNIFPMSFSLEEGLVERVNRVQLEIQQAAQYANRNIYSAFKVEGEGGKRMGSTLVMSYFFQGYAILANVGDSRGYLYRDGHLRQLTQDHTVLNRWLEANQITEAEAERLRSKNARFVTRALGARPKVEMDIYIEPICLGDLYLLCTDGLTDLVEDGEIRGVLEWGGGGDLEGIAKRLVGCANARGGKDNITVVLASFEAVSEGEDTEFFYRDKEPATEVFRRDRLQ
ncbi:MAG: serine/threonine-protein phosphatase [Planctomycetota bacterium]|nr:MAG: serine/threonine-protein phosphatase [Planctomycetota bacterium]